MSKPEVQPSAPLQPRVLDIVVLLLLAERIPNPLLLLVPPDIVCLGEQEKHNSQEVDDE